VSRMRYSRLLPALTLLVWASACGTVDRVPDDATSDSDRWHMVRDPVTGQVHWLDETGRDMLAPDEASEDDPLYVVTDPATGSVYYTREIHLLTAGMVMFRDESGQNLTIVGATVQLPDIGWELGRSNVVDER
jgi:hypothetical protein